MAGVACRDVVDARERLLPPCLNPRPWGVALPGKESNLRPAGNSRLSVPLDHLASIAYRDGESNPGFRDENPAS